MSLAFPSRTKYINRKHYHHVLASRIDTRETFIVTSLAPDPDDCEQAALERAVRWDSDEG